MTETIAQQRYPDRPIPKVSVIFVSFNTVDLTLRALETLVGEANRTDVSIETIVVDNASRDGSVEAIAAGYPDVVLIPSQENLGFGRGNNRGAEHASGEILFFLNTDTEVRPGLLDALVRTFDRDSKIGAVGARLENPDGTHQRSAILVPSLWRIFCEFFWLDRSDLSFLSGTFQNDFDPDIEQDIEVAHGAALAVRRDLFEKVGRFDPDYFMYFEEADICSRIVAEGYRVRFVPTARVMHHSSASSSDRPWWLFRAMRQSRAIFVRKHLSVLSRLILPIVVHAGYAVRILFFTLAGVVNPRLRKLGRQMIRSYTNRSGPDREGRG